MRNLEEFNNFHSGKVAFIIGSGPSLQMLDLAPLKDYVTFAVNSGYLAFPNADYFVSDDWSVARWSYFFNDLQKSKRTIALLYEKMLAKEAWRFGDRSVIFRHRTGYHITDSYNHNNPKNHICQARTSAGTAIHIAHIMGCSKIVLIGIDCRRQNSQRYFWSSKTSKPFRSDTVLPDQYKKTFLNGFQTDTDLIDILSYWENNSCYMNEKCKIYNASPISVVESFEKVNFDKFVSENKEGRKNV